MSLSSGHKVVPVEGAEDEEQKKCFKGYNMGMIRLEPGGWFLTSGYTEYADEYYTFQYRPTDVLVMTYPKCGTTWMQEIVWAMRHDPNLTEKTTLGIGLRVPFMELDSILYKCDAIKNTKPAQQDIDYFFKFCPNGNPADGKFFINLSKNIPNPRSLKTHLPLSLVSPNILDHAKVIYVARNPKDTLVSYYHHSRLFTSHGYVSSLEQFVDLFIQDKLLWSPYWLHLKEAWAQKDHPNLHWVFFEDLKANPISEIKKIDTFLGTQLTDEQLMKINEHTSFTQMQERNTIMSPGTLEQYCTPEVFKKDGGFFRKGNVGSYKEKLTPEIEAKLDLWIKENTENFDFQWPEH